MGKKKDKKNKKNEKIRGAIAKNQLPLDYSTTPVISGSEPAAHSVLGGGDRELTKECIETALMALSLADTLQHGS